MNNKAALRVAIRARRDAFVAGHPPAIAVPRAFAERLAPGRIVATYHPIGSEADPAELVAAAQAAGCRLALPHVVRRAEPMRFLAWDGRTPLVSGPFGLQQPPANAPAADPDIILTPLIGFDRRLERLGQGAGYYDRAFVAHPSAWRIGIAWSVQEVDALQPEPWDVPLHALLTEREWITP